MNACGILLFVAAAATTAAGSYLPAHATTQYHTQDEWGRYAYGYSGGPSAKHEQRTEDGVTRGGYSYVDPHGVVQSVSYVSDPVNGFRAAGTNLPVDKAAVPVVVHRAAPVPVVHGVPAVAAVHSYGSAVVHHDAAVPVPAVYHRSIVPVAAPVATSYTSVVRHDPPRPVHVPVYYAAAAAVPVARVYHPAVPVPVQRYHAQDEHGQYAYGYADGESAKSETRYADGTTVGGYSYVDDRGTVQTVHYTAGVDGFTAAGTNIPVHHV